MRGFSSLVLFIIGLAITLQWFEDNKSLFVLLWQIVLVIVPLATIGGFINEFFQRKRYVKYWYDKPTWYGAMECNKCFYDWQSRRNTPPAKCPSCSSKDIDVVYVYEKAIKQVERSVLTVEDWEQIPEENTITTYPSWLFLTTIFTVFEFIFIYAMYSS
ncbi:MULTISPECIES: hypothetical protein [unclassified Oleiphilus]|uniref:hypothetical protein n=1 Tax=unclassified Oleiphilus TaxID=2631174 RepID=UPI0007C3B775|nr:MULTISPECIES: hypothetical protein [unclassified Oleiphilus]KZY42510.1 hypothetical protein A3732_02470 [Oleiphilus sp. HI0050]KZY73797.1 hypothetical protein A3740_18120 [Oleiphilus sp. HI0068]KZY78583.1 hypothetical protein A3741_08370 [Oleiphilus sp. HI0069]KZY78328.1 hypothetical protein A3740_07875 [Oleiphilus sp. HI0068]KZZ33928.1 hypothetical protein A3757_00455 [Oleiphilus sp. HI0117]